MPSPGRRYRSATLSHALRGRGQAADRHGCLSVRRGQDARLRLTDRLAWVRAREQKDVVCFALGFGVIIGV